MVLRGRYVIELNFLAIVYVSDISGLKKISRYR